MNNGKVDSFPNATIKIDTLFFDPGAVDGDYTLQSKHTQVYPQPFKSIVNIEFELQNDADIIYQVINEAGQTVYTSDRIFMMQGNNKIQWNGTDTQGTFVLSGTYFLKIKNGNSIINEKVLLIK
jgi:flagellar hook assembly protein FlgD